MHGLHARLARMATSTYMHLRLNAAGSDQSGAHAHAHAHHHARVGKAPRHDVMGSVSACMGIVEREVSHGHGMNWVR